MSFARTQCAAVTDNLCHDLARVVNVGGTRQAGWHRLVQDLHV
jgi:hypothetical protein